MSCKQLEKKSGEYFQNFPQICSIHVTQSAHSNNKIINISKILVYILIIVIFLWTLFLKPNILSGNSLFGLLHATRGSSSLTVQTFPIITAHNQVRTAARQSHRHIRPTRLSVRMSVWKEASQSQTENSGLQMNTVHSLSQDRVELLITICLHHLSEVCVNVCIEKVVQFSRWCKKGGSIKVCVDVCVIKIIKGNDTFAHHL